MDGRDYRVSGTTRKYSLSCPNRDMRDNGSVNVHLRFLFLGGVNTAVLVQKQIHVVFGNDG